MTTPERAEARADLVAFIKALPCARPEEAIRIAAKWGMAGCTPSEVRDALNAAVSRGIHPRDFVDEPMESSDGN